MVIFEGREYAKIDKFDCRVLDFSHEKGGGYCTILPISPKAYRKRRGNMPDKVEVYDDGKFTTFKITDDWHKEYTVAISNDHRSEIQAAIEAAKEEGLMI